MNIEECPFCGENIDMDWEMVDYIADGGDGPHEFECPYCGEIMIVEVEWEPIYRVQTPQQSTGQE